MAPLSGHAPGGPLNLMHVRQNPEEHESDDGDI